MIDYLSWRKFEKGTVLNSKKKLIKIKDFNRMVCHSKNFFCIIGYGCFNLGYSIIIPKKLISSFALLDKELINEFKYFINLIQSFIIENFNFKKVLKFEHGMCACLGGLDRAHLHLMPSNASDFDIIDSVNSTLERRLLGIENVIWNNKVYKSYDDISEILNNKLISKQNYVVLGKQKNLLDIRSDLCVEEYPLNLRSFTLKNFPYIYFDTGTKDSSFITFEKIDTQFGREVSFNSQQNNNKKNYFEWRWQENKFEKNIFKTIEIYKENFYKFLKNNKKYNINTFI